MAVKKAQQSRRLPSAQQDKTKGKKERLRRLNSVEKEKDPPGTRAFASRYQLDSKRDPCGIELAWVVVITLNWELQELQELLLS